MLVAGLNTADVAWHQLILAQLTEKYLKEEQQLRLKFNSYEKRASDLILLPLKVFVQGGRKTPSQARRPSRYCFNASSILRFELKS